MNIRRLLSYIRIKLISIVPMYAVLDGEDQSVTLSKRLYRSMCILGLMDNNRVYVFKVGERYAFTVNPKQFGEEETNLYTVQYNPQYKTIGFCPTTPSVVRILVESGKPYNYHGKIRVKACYAKGIIYFKFIP